MTISPIAGHGCVWDSSVLSRKCIRIACASRGATVPLQSESPHLRWRVNGDAVGAGGGCRIRHSRNVLDAAPGPGHGHIAAFNGEVLALVRVVGEGVQGARAYRVARLAEEALQ